MRKLRFIFVLLLFVTFSLLGVQAQVENIEIWENEIPGAIDREGYELVKDSNENWTFMLNITKPNIDVYIAPKEKATGAAIIICPGGSYYALAYKHEGAEVAKWFNSIGVSAFVLHYRLPDTLIMHNKTIGPLQDAQKTMRYLRNNASKWNINPNKIGIIGFSAGGHVASTLSTHYNDTVYEHMDTTSARPDFSVLIYPVISMDTSITHLKSRQNLLGNDPTTKLVNFYSNDKQVNKFTPPTFLVHTMDDEVVPMQNSMNYAAALQNHKVPCELHLYESGGHGFGLGNTKNSESQWPQALVEWLNMRGVL